jgi:hypothetical protein
LVVNKPIGIVAESQPIEKQVYFGYLDFCRLHTLHQAGAYLVIRARKNLRFVRLGVPPGTSRPPATYEDGKTDFAVWPGDSEWYLICTVLATSRSEWPYPAKLCCFSLIIRISIMIELATGLRNLDGRRCWIVVQRLPTSQGWTGVDPDGAVPVQLIQAFVSRNRAGSWVIVQHLPTS